jgi:hypothetical protein
MLVDEFLPVYDVSDSVATVVQADLATTWDALMEVDLIEVGRRRPLVAVLGALRALPDIVSHVLHGEPPVKAPQQLRLRDTTQIPLGEGGWVLLGERRQEEIAPSFLSRRSQLRISGVSQSQDSPRPCTRYRFGRWTNAGPS